MNYCIKLSVWLCRLWVLLAIASCTPAPTYNPYAEPNSEYLEVLDNDSCWMEICARKTTWEEAYSILEETDFALPEQIEFHRKQNEFVVPMMPTYGTTKVVINYYDNIMNRITLTDFNSNLSLEQVMEVYGEPDWVYEKEVGIGGPAILYGAVFELGYTDIGVTVSVNGLSWGRLDSPTDAGLLDPNFCGDKNLLCRSSYF